MIFFMYKKGLHHGCNNYCIYYHFKRTYNAQRFDGFCSSIYKTYIGSCHKVLSREKMKTMNPNFRNKKDDII